MRTFIRIRVERVNVRALDDTRLSFDNARLSIHRLLRSDMAREVGLGPCAGV